MFKSALPVFASGKEREMNYQLLLRTHLDSLSDSKLYIKMLGKETKNKIYCKLRAKVYKHECSKQSI